MLAEQGGLENGSSLDPIQLDRATQIGLPQGQAEVLESQEAERLARQIETLTVSAREALEVLPGNDRWHGPFVTPTGTQHFFRVIGENAPTAPEFEAARDWVATQWLVDKSRELLDLEIESVKDEYRIEVIPQAAEAGDA